MAQIQPTYDYDVEADTIRRRQALIDAMQQQALQPLQQTTAMGIPVKTSPLEGIAKIFQAYAASRKGDELKAERQALAQRYGEDLRTGMENFERTAFGYEAPSMVREPLPDGTLQTQQVPGDKRKAIYEALASTHPVLREFAMGQLKDIGRGTLTPKDLAERATPESVLLNPNDPTKWEPTRKLTPVTAGEILLDASGRVAAPGVPAGGGTILGGGAQTSSPSGPGWGTVTLNGDLYQVSATGLKKLDNAAKITTNTQVNASPVVMGQRAGAQEYFKNAAQQVDALGKEANSSQKLLTTLSTLEQLQAAGINSNITSGMVTTLQNLGQAVGVKVDPSKLGNTEAYNSLITDLWQRSVSQYGGNRGVTKDEAEEIKKLTPMAAYSPQARGQIIAIQKAGAQRSIQAYKEANDSFAQAAAADDPRLFKIPSYIEGAYVPEKGNIPNPDIAPVRKVKKWSDL